MAFCPSSMRWWFVALCPSLLLACPVLESRTAKDKLVIGWDVKPQSGDPRFIGSDANSRSIEELRFLPLVSFDENGLLKNVVMESAFPEGKTNWRLKIRSGIHFASGKDLTADDVVATYQRIIFPTSEQPLSPRQRNFENVASIRKLSPNEVMFELKEPASDFLSKLVIGILPVEAISVPPEQVTGKGFESGPYRLEKSSNTEWRFKKNEAYDAEALKATAPRTPQVIFKILPDVNSRFVALLNGEVDVLQNTLNSVKIAEIDKKYSTRFQILTKAQNSVDYLAFNMRHPVFQKQGVRKAIAKALDRSEIINFSLNGMALPAKEMFAPGNPFFDDSVQALSYDPAGAMRLLDQEGYKDPDGSGPRPRLVVSMKVPNDAERIDVAKSIAGQLGRIGIQLDLEILESNVFQDQLNKGNVAIWLGASTGIYDPDALGVFESQRTPPHGRNFGFYQNRTVDELLGNEKSEFDQKKRVARYAEAQKIINEELPYVFLWHKVNHAVVANNVVGYQLFADGRYTSLVDVEKR